MCEPAWHFAAMAPWHKRILLVDLDPQFNASQYMLGVQRYETQVYRANRPTIWDIVEQATRRIHRPLARRHIWVCSDVPGDVDYGVAAWDKARGILAVMQTAGDSISRSCFGLPAMPCPAASRRTAGVRSQGTGIKTGPVFSRACSYVKLWGCAVVGHLVAASTTSLPSWTGSHGRRRHFMQNVPAPHVRSSRSDRLLWDIPS